MVESQTSKVGVGQRIYGYLPMAEFAVLRPETIHKHGFVDGSPHRDALPRVYNEYTFTAADPFHSRRSVYTKAFVLLCGWRARRACEIACIIELRLGVAALGVLARLDVLDKVVDDL